MSAAERLREAVTPIVPELAEDEYTGESSIFCTYNITENPIGHGNNRPHAIQYLIQLHLHLPFADNAATMKKSLRQAIIAANFTAPTVETVEATVLEGRHIVFEFEDVDGEV